MSSVSTETLQKIKKKIDAKIKRVRTCHLFIFFSPCQVQETQKFVTTILDVQPRVATGGGGKSNDEIVFELAESIEGKLIEKLDIEQANAIMFEVCTKQVGFGNRRVLLENP